MLDVKYLGERWNRVSYFQKLDQSLELSFDQLFVAPMDNNQPSMAMAKTHTSLGWVKTIITKLKKSWPHIFVVYSSHACPHYIDVGTMILI